MKAPPFLDNRPVLLVAGVAAAAFLLGGDVLVPREALRLWSLLTHVVLLAIGTALILLVRSLHAQAAETARTDPLTGVLNVRSFENAAGREIERARRSGRPLCLAYVDVDDFRLVNERSGRLVGDDLLRLVAVTLARNVRSTDAVGRLGGDEFAVLFPETDAAAADAVLEKIDGALKAETARADWRVGFSIGAVTFRTPPRDVNAAVRAAESAMYLVKEGGKNDIHHEVA